MEIALHLGVHETDNDHLVRCLMRNRAVLGKQGIAIPGPARYRQQLRQLSFAMRGRDTTAETQEMLLDGILDDDDVRRVVFSSDSFLSLPKWAVSHGRLYHAAAERVSLLRNLFPDARIELFLAIRNPASFLPAMVKADKTGSILTQITDSDPGALRWSSLLARLSEAVPDAPITVWSYEDTPLIWPEVLRVVSGHAPENEMAGWLAWYWDLVTPKGHAALRRWFETNPPPDDHARRKMLSVLLERFAKPEELEQDALLPGWTVETVDRLSALYDDDLDLIGSMPGVTLLEP
ncbi:hypothetical protein [Pararhodobacter zhoushanensis]|uniref:Sulfotransferase family protein n=1 Tax=Pararhodobacter zhoushanensis TaxID=2479545 RepID=A0ABT3H0P0_9RHOB|nr:hypothetical protein [Pararhodobacter zhoushanensis]MCW1933352.1 hypothetical protein [Pararhodobacter zhoushanensis]